MRPDHAHVQPYRIPIAPRQRLEVLDPEQRPIALGFLKFRASGPVCLQHPHYRQAGCVLCQQVTDWETETVARAAAMLRADQSSPMSVRMMGLTEAQLAEWDAGDDADLAG